MLLSKLKITACAGALMLLAGVGVSGLTYRATAQSPRPKETLASRSQTDELEALRLEIEALRKSHQATRERVKTLEGEVSTLKGQRQGPPRIAPDGGRGGRPGSPPGQGPGAGGPPQAGAPQAQSLPVIPQGEKAPGTQRTIVRYTRTDPMKDAENALKKLKESPGDTKATEALEKALQRLKEREKPNVFGEKLAK